MGVKLVFKKKSSHAVYTCPCLYIFHFLCIPNTLNIPYKEIVWISLCIQMSRLVGLEPLSKFIVLVIFNVVEVLLIM